MKVIIINTPKGQYQIPSLPVAEQRADYYAEVDGHEIGSTEWKEEVDYALNDDYEVIDWLINNSDWEDWEGVATKLNEKVKVTDDDFWCCSDDFEIKEI